VIMPRSVDISRHVTRTRGPIIDVQRFAVKSAVKLKTGNPICPNYSVSHRSSYVNCGIELGGATR